MVCTSSVLLCLMQPNNIGYRSMNTGPIKYQLRGPVHAVASDTADTVVMAGGKQEHSNEAHLNTLQNLPLLTSKLPPDLQTGQTQSASARDPRGATHRSMRHPPNPGRTGAEQRSPVQVGGGVLLLGVQVHPVRLAPHGRAQLVDQAAPVGGQRAHPALHVKIPALGRLR